MRAANYAGSVIVTFCLGYFDENQVTVRADYHRIFKDDNEVWRLEATPIENILDDYSKPSPFLEFKPIPEDGTIPDEAVAVSLGSGTYGVVVENGISMPGIPEKTPYKLSEVVAPVVRTGFIGH